MRRSFGLAITLLAGFAAATVNAQPSPDNDPPGRVGRLAFVDGTVSFHDSQQLDWSPAVPNTPLTSGDAVWTEPNARSEVSIAGTRVRLDGGTELDMLAIDDSQTRLQLGQGRVDIKTFAYDASQPYQIVTPRGVVTLQQQGDYYVEAGSTRDPTRLGVRQGAAQIQAANGQVLAVRAGEIGEISGDYDSPQLRRMETAPPPMPAYWAARDRAVVHDQPQYVSYDVTGYEDLNYYGAWSNDPDYGQVWIPRAVAADWAPYRTGHWAYVRPWGWTWIDDQPWGFAPYHYGRWAERNGRWMWVAPQRDLRPVYAPALVAFVDGVELSIVLGQQGAAPVGWFPLGPREAYVPPYTANRDYYRRINAPARVQAQVMDERWQRAERHEALRADDRSEQLMNRRFATVVPAATFTRSEPVARAALRVDPQKLSAAPVAPVSAPPAMAISAPAQPRTQGQPRVAPTNVPTAQTRFANMQTLAQPSAADAPHRAAPGPKLASRPAPIGNEPGKPSPPAFAPHIANAPAPPQVARPEPPRTNEPAHPSEPPRVVQPQHASPAAPAPPAAPAAPPPNVQQHQVAPAQPVRPAEAPRPQPQPLPAPQPQVQHQATPREAPQQVHAPLPPHHQARQQHAAPTPPQPQPPPQPQQQQQHLQQAQQHLQQEQKKEEKK